MNVLENIPFSDDGLGKRKLVDEKDFLVMQIALRPGQSVPKHDANSNVHLLVLEGTVKVDLAGTLNVLKKGDLVPVVYRTPMQITNTSDKDASFLVLKTPNPSQMG